MVLLERSKTLNPSPVLQQGSINLITRSLEAVGRKMELIEDPVTVHYHLPNGLSVQVHRKYEEFLTELISRFPHEEAGIRTFYGECWKVGLSFSTLSSVYIFEPVSPHFAFGPLSIRGVPSLSSREETCFDRYIMLSTHWSSNLWRSLFTCLASSSATL